MKSRPVKDAEEKFDDERDVEEFMTVWNKLRDFEIGANMNGIAAAASRIFGDD